MVEHLALVLDVPLRERNALLGAAGFAPAFSEEPLDGPALAVVRRHLEQLVEAHRPFPAYVIDRCWNLQIANEAALAVTALLLPADACEWDDGLEPGRTVRMGEEIGELKELDG